MSPCWAHVMRSVPARVLRYALEGGILALPANVDDHRIKESYRRGRCAPLLLCRASNAVIGRL